MSYAHQDPATASAPRVIEVVAKRFEFEPARVEVSEGERIRLMVKSADGPHGIAIKKFKISKTIKRGDQPIAIDFTATAAGEFPIVCSEFCGEGHDDMKGMLVVRVKDDDR